MKSVSVAVFVVGAAAYLLSLFLPANSDWLGFFWATFALEVALRGPQGAADFPLFLLVSAANALMLLAPFALAGAKSWGKIVAHLLVVAAIGGAGVCVRYHPSTWAMGYYAWCAALGIMAVAIYLRAASAAAPEPRPARAAGTTAGALRRTRTP